MNRQLNLLLFGVLLLLLAACGQDAQPVGSTPSFSFDVDPAATSVTLDKTGATAPAAQATGECGATEPRILMSGDELELSNYTFAFLPGSILKVTVSFTNTTDFTYEQPFTFSSDEAATTNIVSSTEPEVTDANLGSDGKLSPDETTRVLTFTVEHKGQAFSYGVSAKAKVSCKGTDPTDPVVPPPLWSVPTRLQSLIRGWKQLSVMN